MDLSPYTKHIYSASLEIPSIFWNPMVYYHVNKNPSPLCEYE